MRCVCLSVFYVSDVLKGETRKLTHHGIWSYIDDQSNLPMVLKRAWPDAGVTSAELNANLISVITVISGSAWGCSVFWACADTKQKLTKQHWTPKHRWTIEVDREQIQKRSLISKIKNTNEPRHAKTKKKFELDFLSISAIFKWIGRANVD